MNHRLAARCLLAAAALSLAATNAALAQAGRIGIVDTRRLLTGSNAGKQVIARLDKIAEEKGAQLKPRQDEIQALQKRIADGRVSLSEDKLMQMQRELEEKVTAAKRLREDLQREMEQIQGEAFDEFERKVAPVVEAYGKEGGFLFILNIGFFNQPNLPSGIVWADAAADVTEELIRRIDAGVS
ncbi:MAG TPA: OmpH family outer membrane protein [Thermoanaerobaculia bacterium]|nr:OmpH family outer membrane protein [Thermoanaerobaculia bacterium]